MLFDYGGIMIEIESMGNSTIKLIRSLKMAKYRKETGLYIVEGVRLVKEAMNYKPPKYIVFSKAYANMSDDMQSENSIVVSDRIFQSLCDTKSPQGVLAVMESDEADKSIGDGVVVAMEDVQNPLNVGTIIRTADALGAAGVILSAECADVYSPKVLRGTMGSIYHLPIVKTKDFCGELKSYKDRGFKLVAGDLQGESMEHIDGNCVMIVGNEGNGITEEVRELCDALWRINMPGKAESLNAAVAAGIMLYTLTN